jgi:hypothetical protein
MMQGVLYLKTNIKAHKQGLSLIIYKEELPNQTREGVEMGISKGIFIDKHDPNWAILYGRLQLRK